MYLEHFGLREAPFSITPHTEFFFAGASRGATLEALIYAITHDEGIVKVSGEVGSGKTMLCRMLLERLPKHVETAYLATPSLSRDDILHAIADELGIDIPDARKHLAMRALQERLLEIHASGRMVVVMIDEAHAMPAESLEEIRLLSNLETNRHKLLHIVLFGQPELDERLNGKDMRQLKDRITHNFALEPLRRDDVGDYLMFRMRAAGYRGPDLFTQRAVALISQASQGLTRRINILADKSLLSAFADNQHNIDTGQIHAAIRDAQFTPIAGNGRPKALLAGALATLVATAFFAWWAANSVPPSPAEEKGSPSAQPVQAAVSDEPPPIQPATEPRSEPRMMQPAALTLDERIAATNEWLKSTPATHYFVQLLSTDANSVDDVQRFVESLSGKVDARQLRIYRSQLSGRDRIGVIYGDYPTREEASAALTAVSRAVPGGGPYIRTVGKLK